MASLNNGPTLIQSINAIQLAATVSKNIFKGSKDTSYLDVTKNVRVEPLTVISEDCMMLDYTGDVLQSMLNIFTGYYLQAAAAISNVNNVEVQNILNKLNPNRQWTSLESNYSPESMKFTLLNFKDIEDKIDVIADTAIDIYGTKLTDTNLSKVNIGEDGLKSVKESVDLSVGKLINVTINVPTSKEVVEFDKKTNTQITKNVTSSLEVKIPVNFRLISNTASTSTVVHLLTYKKENTSLKERYHQWRSGRISFFNDLVLCDDLIKEHKKALLEDKSNLLLDINNRVNKTKTIGIVSGNPSLAVATNLYVISEDVARQVEMKLNGKLSNLSVREKAFAGTYAMIIAVIDREWERVTFYTKGISRGAELSIKDIKSANKNKGPDIMDIFRSLSVGNAPSF